MFQDFILVPYDSNVHVLSFSYDLTVMCPQVLWGQVIVTGEGGKKGSWEMSGSLFKNSKAPNSAVEVRHSASKSVASREKEEEPPTDKKKVLQLLCSSGSQRNPCRS